MEKGGKNKSIANGIQFALIFLACACIVVLDFFTLPIGKDEFIRRYVTEILQRSLGVFAGVLLVKRLNMRLFGRIEKWLYLLPCMLVALDNFQWNAYFQGKMQLVRAGVLDVCVFALRCLAVGVFEEILFRGILFGLFADLFSKDRKGFFKTYLFSSLAFGVAHLFNGFSLAALLQVGYTVLTGGLFAFCFIKTKNILCPALVHATYNFCGLLFDTQGLGAGVVFDIGTVITMLVISVVVGVFVLYKVWTYSDAERKELYSRLGIAANEEHTEEEV